MERRVYIPDDNENTGDVYLPLMLITDVPKEIHTY